MNTPITLICKTHGIFNKDLQSLMKGQGCIKCRSLYYDTFTYVSKVINVHNNFYDYSKTIFVSAKDTIDIICPVHGVFNMLPYNHYKGYGCTLCGISTASKVRTYTTEQFIDLANKLHSDSYSYVKTNYVSCTTKITVTCPSHRRFYCLTSYALIS